VKRLKILVLNKKERLYSSNRAIDRILEVLKEKNQAEVFWILMESGQGDLSGYSSKPVIENYKFLEDYKTDDVLQILDCEKPDVILCSNDYDFWSRSFVLAAKYKKIPTVLLMQFGFEYAWERSDSIIRGRLSHFINRRGYLVGKYSLLLKTYRKIGLGISSILKNIIQDFFVTFSQFEPSGRYGCDLILVHNEQLKNTILKNKINSKIIITGDPQMDSVFSKISNLKKTTLTKHDSKLNGVFLTTSMVEHGLWTQKMWEETVIQTISIVQKKLSNKVDLVLKIHPSSEKKDDYEKLLKKHGIQIPIFQTEHLLDIINDADFIISYGDTWALWEAMFMKKPIIIVNLFNYSQDMMPFVKEKIAYEITEINQIIKMILKIQSHNLEESKINQFIKKYLYKLDGNAGLRSAEAILDLVGNYNKLET